MNKQNKQKLRFSVQKVTNPSVLIVMIIINDVEIERLAIYM
jgi:hypothetical protein